MIKRNLTDQIVGDLKSKMVFIGGPRQVGKTTLARLVGDSFFSHEYQYLNWDYREDRQAILQGRFTAGQKLLVFDEIHKYRNWKNYLKGEFDKHKAEHKILVTGSSRLDVFRKGGDSLLGRYHYYRLHPLSVAELSGQRNFPVPLQPLALGEHPMKAAAVCQRLFRFGGFPDQWLQQDEKELRRWHNERSDRLIREDIRDLEAIRDLSSLQVLVELVQERAGGQLSLNALTEDLKVTHKTAAAWMDVLEKFYYLFRIYPYQSTRIRSLRKEPKLYLWDWSEIEDAGRRFENLIASHLLKLCHYLQDTAGHRLQLYYLRDKQQREVDFLVTLGTRPWFCVEAKLTETKLSPALKYYQARLGIPYVFQVVNIPQIDLVQDAIRIISAEKFLAALV
jgi:predicted AAA+ superfamily ATPase